ncbi:hypothetical protein INT44_001257, partial [Umbelopsis vinacea]
SLSLVTIAYADTHAGLFYREPAAPGEVKASVHIDLLNDLELDPASLYQSRNQQNFEPDSKSLSTKDKQNAVKEEFVFAWEGYKKYSWSYDENRPVSNSYSNPRNGWGATIVDALDTLYIMGLTGEFAKATEFVAGIDWAHPPTSSHVQLFETIIRYVGGLLSAYDLSYNPIFVDRAVALADRLLPAFNSSTGIPYQYIDITTGTPLKGGPSVLAEIGTVQLEFFRLSDITGDPKYREATQRPAVFNQLLYPGEVWETVSTRSYLAKSYVYSGYRDDQKKRMFVDTVRSTLKHMIVSPKGHPDIKLLAELNGDKKRHVMDELACFVPGTFLLAADTIPELHDIVGIASELLESCVLAWTSTKTGIAPEIFGWVDPETGEFPVPKSDRAIELADKYGVFPVVDSYILRPETLESIFYFYRYTKDEKYRDMGWEIFQSIQLHCRANSGYTGIRYVDSISPEWDDRQERLVITHLSIVIYVNVANQFRIPSFFFAETMKYLYLLFDDTNVLPLDEWVFNTEAHPLRIQK